MEQEESVFYGTLSGTLSNGKRVEFFCKLDSDSHEYTIKTPISSFEEGIRILQLIFYPDV